MVFRSFKMLLLVSAYLFVFNVHIMDLVSQNLTTRYSESINIHELKSINIKKRLDLIKCNSINNIASTFTDNGIIKKDFTGVLIGLGM